YGGFLRKYP
nr:endorphin beta,neo [Sus scrofa domesticus]